MNNIHLQRTAIAITQRCTLKCKLCNAYIPYYKNPLDLPFDQISQILHRYFAILDRVKIFGVLGGEPLIHPDISKILNKINDYSNQITERIDLVTNGTLDMNDETIKFFVKNAPKAKVIISHYGKHSPKADVLAEKLKKHGANYRVANYHGENLLYDGWIDYRDHSKKHFTQETIEQQAKDCIVRKQRYYLISEGEMHTCTRAHWRMRQGIIPRNLNEYINLLDNAISIEQQKIILAQIESQIHTTSCAYCAGSNNERERYYPAEQL